MFSHEHGLDQRLTPMSLFSVTKVEMVQEGVDNSCVMSMSLFSATQMEMVYFLIVNARLRRAHKFLARRGRLEPISPFSKCAVFLGFDVHRPSHGCKIWFQKAEFKKDLTRLRSDNCSSEAKISLFF